MSIENPFNQNSPAEEVDTLTEADIVEDTSKNVVEQPEEVDTLTEADIVEDTSKNVVEQPKEIHSLSNADSIEDMSGNTVEQPKELEKIEEIHKNTNEQTKPRVRKLGFFGSILAGVASIIGVGASSNNAAEAAPRGPYVERVKTAAPEHEEHTLSAEKISKGVQDINDYLYEAKHGLDRYTLEFNPNNNSNIIVDHKQVIHFLKDKVMSDLVKQFQHYEHQIEMASNSSDKNKDQKIAELRTEQFRAMERTLESLTR